jgi:hypothetical protein
LAVADFSSFRRNAGLGRSVIADISKRITRLQAEHGLPRYHVTVFETSGGVHAHNVFVGNSDIVRRLKGSAYFGAIIKIKAVFDPDGLARGYLAKERTPQAGYGRQHLLGGRIRGSHRLEGDGDRVRLSRHLERDAIEDGYVEAWPHTNARRSTERKPYRLRRLFPRKAPRLVGQHSASSQIIAMTRGDVTYPYSGYVTMGRRVT